MNADLGAWAVAMVKSLGETFSKATSFTGAGLYKWNLANVNERMENTFVEATSIEDCDKRMIANAWTTDTDGSFGKTSYAEAWRQCTCVGVQMTDAMLKQASWGTSRGMNEMFQWDLGA